VRCGRTHLELELPYWLPKARRRLDIAIGQLCGAEHTRSRYRILPPYKFSSPDSPSLGSKWGPECRPFGGTA
jgi:hypothetical protein